MAYTDVELKNATQVAYSFDKEYSILENSGQKPPYTIEQLCEVSAKPGQTASQRCAEVFPDLDNSSILDWQIVDRYDNNGKDGTGFYGCVIKTGDGDAIVAFRGSEGMMDGMQPNWDNLAHDWYDGDLKLLNSEMTTQQADAQKFVEQIQNSDYINDINNLSFTGHSLGGNLAEFAAIEALDGPMASKVERCVNFDGPGFSTEYIDKLKKDPELMAAIEGKIDHYWWSAVGNMLYPVPGSNKQHIKIKQFDEDGGVLGNLGYVIIGKHSTTSVIFDENGMVIPGGRPLIGETIMGQASRIIDGLPSWMGNAALGIITGTLSVALWTWDKFFDKDGLSDFGKGVLTAAGIFFLFHPGMILPAIGAIAGGLLFLGAGLIALVGIVMLAELALDLLKNIIDAAIDFVKKAGEWLKDRIEDIGKFFGNLIKGIGDWFKKNFDEGYKYAMSHPIFEVKTDALLSYRDRVSSLRNRAYWVEERLERLMRETKCPEIWVVVHQRWLSTQFSTLDKCSRYLSEAYNRMTSVENKLTNAIG